MARFTVLGGTGFVGGHLARHLRARGDEVALPGRDAAIGADLGHVVYAIGLTADFRSRPFAAMESHVCRLARLLERARFDSLLYLSSTRVYSRAASGAEDALVPVDSQCPDDLYNLSKLAGESLCLAGATPTVRVARLSNVFGPPADGAGMHPASLVADLLRAAVNDHRIRLASSPESEKDYVAIGDVVQAIRRIALQGRHRLYNVASGENTSNHDLVRRLAALTGCAVELAKDAPTVRFPRIHTDRLSAEFAGTSRPWAPLSVLDWFPTALNAARMEPALAGART
jgi:nucleoside-diphosphate-sugar epimerase